jgi:DNA polymerase-3 subunit epsilon
VKEALEDCVPIRRCTKAMRAKTRFAACALADMGRCLAPCDGRTDPERYGELVRRLVSSLSTCPDGLLATLETRMASLAQQERFEEAASVRDRLRALAEALWRARQDAWLVGAGTLVVHLAGGELLRFEHGALTRAGGAPSADPLGLPCPRERADELAAVRSWLARHPVRVGAADVAPCEPVAGGAAIARIRAQMRDADLPPLARPGRAAPRGAAQTGR